MKTLIKKFKKYPTPELEKKLKIDRYTAIEKAAIRKVLESRNVEIEPEKEKELQVYCKTRKHGNIYGIYRDGKILINDKEYKTPTAAAASIIGTTKINGWKFWRYMDGEVEKFISKLR